MVMDEATRNLIDKWSMEPEKARRREEELRFGGIEQRPNESIKGGQIRLFKRMAVPKVNLLGRSGCALS
jgi:hypothetical protein